MMMAIMMLMIIMMVMLIVITKRIIKVEYIWLSSLNAMRIMIYFAVAYEFNQLI